MASELILNRSVSLDVHSEQTACSDEELHTEFINRTRKRIITDTDDENKDQSNPDLNSIPMLNNEDNVVSEEINIIEPHRQSKSRLKVLSSDESDNDVQKPMTDNEKNTNTESTGETRIKKKQNMVAFKFKSLILSRSNKSEFPKESSDNNDTSESRVACALANICDKSTSSDNNSTDGRPITKIKKKVKKNNKVRTISDQYGSSDDETQKHSSREKGRKNMSIKMMSPIESNHLEKSGKHRMSTKQAMENMQVIKSESNRMLREKQVTLPYHRPKPLSLREIMDRRRPIVSSNGKAVPLKMNEEQLRQYALQLECQQKELLELCKSDHEEEDAADINIDCDKAIINDDTVANDNDDTFDAIRNIHSNTNTFNHDNQSIGQSAADNIDLPPIGLSLNSDITRQVNKQNQQITEGSTEACTHITDDTVVNDNDDTFDAIRSIHSNTNMFNHDNQSIGQSAADNIDLPPIGLSLNSDTTRQVNEQNQQITEDSTEACTHITDYEETKCDKPQNDSTEQLINKELDSQLINLHYDSEKSQLETLTETNVTEENIISKSNMFENLSESGTAEKCESQITVDSNICKDNVCELLEIMSDEDINMYDIDEIIDNANKTNDDFSKHKQSTNSPMLQHDTHTLITNPKLLGAPGMVIDLDGDSALVPKKLSGVELLKERFRYFSNMKTQDEMEREKDKRYKPGTQHFKLKQELEEQIAEQRSLEWLRRIEEEKQKQIEIDAMTGDDELESVEAKLNEEYAADAKENGDDSENTSDNEESELEENDIIIKDDKRKQNPLIADEAEESDVDGEEDNLGHSDKDDEDKDITDDELSDSDDCSESSDEEQQNVQRKGRILKAFEDSDNDDDGHNEGKCRINKQQTVSDADKIFEIPVIIEEQMTQDDEELQSAQVYKSQSDDMFASQFSTESAANEICDAKITHETKKGEKGSLLHSKIDVPPFHNDIEFGEKITVICSTQPGSDVNLDDVALMCSGSFSQNLVTSQLCPPETQNTDDNFTQCTEQSDEEILPQLTEPIENNVPAVPEVIKPTEEPSLLLSILEEMDDPELESHKVNKHFCNENLSTVNEENKKNSINVALKSRFVIESDDEAVDITAEARKKKSKRKHRENRTLRLSDDEDDLDKESDVEASDLDDEECPNIVEYDSEENEVKVQPKKLNRKASEFLEHEAELTSEDEWMGSGDEDEAGLDRMEREAGDDDAFHQGQLRKELGQIHMREVMDQDKREVRLLQELLLEDGDLGEGHRQRKFRWKNSDGEEASGTVPDELADTQEDEFESEEQWRKQRHERETFLRQMKDPDHSKDGLNTSITRNAIIKANLHSKSMSSLLMEIKTPQPTTDCEVIPQQNKKNVPSPVKTTLTLQQKPCGSLLSRGRGALERLAALATPLAADAEQEPTNMSALAPKRRNFVFTALTPPGKEETKVAKRKAVTEVGTPNLVKRLKAEESQKPLKRSLLDQINN